MNHPRVHMGKKALYSLLVALLLTGAFRFLNDALMRGVGGDLRAVGWPLATATALAVAALSAWFASARAGHEVTPAVLVVTLTVLTAAGYAAFLTFVPVHRFGTAATEPPRATIEENYPRRGRHTYRTNALGFRGPEWSEAKAPGTVRGVVIGDSMVFGSGVDDDDTIDATLASRLRRTHAATTIEVLNLGVEGTNLPGYVELFRAATQRLAPDFVVLCLLLPNDLGELEQPSEGDRLGAFSFFAFLTGTNNNPYTLFTMRATEARSDDAKLAFLAEHAAAIERIRRAGAPVPLFVWLYHADDARWAETLRDRLGPGAWVVPRPTLPDDDFIPGDGHPTAAGNRHFAEIVGDAIDGSAAVGWK